MQEGLDCSAFDRPTAQFPSPLLLAPLFCLPCLASPVRLCWLAWECALDPAVGHECCRRRCCWG